MEAPIQHSARHRHKSCPQASTSNPIEATTLCSGILEAEVIRGLPYNDTTHGRARPRLGSVAAAAAAVTAGGDGCGGGGCACSGGGAVVNLVSSGSARRLYRSELRTGVGCKPRSGSLGLKGYGLPVAGFQWLRVFQGRL